MAKKKINVQGLEISLSSFNKEDYISLTDIAKQATEQPRFTIQNWMRNNGTIRYLYEWEQVHNPILNRVQMDTVLEKGTDNRFIMSPSKWIDLIGAKGIISKAGRNGGTYAHPDITLNFCYWLSPTFQIYFIKEFQRLKKETLGLEWNVRRELTKINYDIHTEAVKDNLIPHHIKGKIKGVYYASEADVLNVALYGCTAKEWRAANPDKKGNIREHSTIHQLTVLANLESLNAVLISDGMAQDERIEKLNKVAIYQLQILIGNSKIKRLDNPEG